MVPMLRTCLPPAFSLAKEELSAAGGPPQLPGTPQRTAVCGTCRWGTRSDCRADDAAAARGYGQSYEVVSMVLLMNSRAGEGLTARVAMSA